MRNPKDLIIWESAIQLSLEIYKLTESFPSNERFSITDQLRRAAVSVPSNISEGCSRNSQKEFKRFLEIAIGSLFEVETQIIISKNVGYINSDTFELISTRINELKFQTLAFINKVKG